MQYMDWQYKEWHSSHEYMQTYYKGVVAVMSYLLILPTCQSVELLFDYLSLYRCGPLDESADVLAQCRTHVSNTSAYSRFCDLI